MGTGKRLKTPRGRSWLRDRAKEGSVLDYNTNYLEAEFEVISQMYYDMRIAKAIEYIDRRYNIIDRLKAEAVNINDERIMPFFEQLASTLTKGAGNEPVTAEELYRAILNKKMAIGFDRLGELASQGVLPDDKGKYADLIAVLGNTYTYNRGKPPEEQARLDDQSTRQLFAYCNWLLKSKDQKTIPGKGAAATIFKGLHEKKKHIKETLGKDYVTWEDLIPEGFSTYQPTKGNMFFFAESIPATIAERLIEGQLQEYSIKKEDLRRVLAKGSKFPEMVVDEKIAMTLEDLTVGSANTSLVGDFFKDILTTWKVYQLISPPRYLKYNLRNLTSDIEYPFALNRGTFKFVPEATKALFDYLFRGASPSGMLRQWIERGGIEATLQSQEMGAINHLKDFERIVNKYKTLKDAPAEVWNSWWKNARLSTDMRESILRYASFVSYVEQMKGNIDKAHVDKNGNIAKGHLHEGRPKNFGASNPEEIMALDNLFDRAYWLSNELLGAYDRVSVAGKWLRKYLMPFWSWNEVNMKRFIQIMRNCANDDLIAEQVGRFFINKRRKQIGVAPVRNNSRIWKSKITRGIAMSPLIAINIGKTTLSLMLLWLLASIWNKIMFPDAQYTIPEHDRKGFHLVVGRNEDGSLIYYNRLGSITDLFEWIGDVPWNYVNDVIKGRKTVMDVAKKIMAAPFVNIYGEVGPHFQITTELITGKSTFPDPTDPGDIRDRVYHIMQGLGLAAVYNRIAGRPTRTWGDEVQRLLAYKQEQGQGAYYDIRDEVREFLKSEGVPQGRWSGERSPKAEALFYLRLAIRYEDARAMEKYAIQYVNNGGNSKDLETSLKNMHPLYGLSKERKRKFYNEWLDDEGRERLRWAEKFYYETLLGNPEGKIGYYPKETMSQISSIVREHKR